MNQINIQSKIAKILKSIYSYNISLNNFNKYYNCFDMIRINQNNKFILENKFLHTTRKFGIDDLKNLNISYKYVKRSKGYYSRYTSKQALNIMRKITILDENAPDYDFYKHMKLIIQNNPNNIFFFGCYEQIPIIQNESDIYQMDLGGLFINIDNNYKYKKQLSNKKMLKDTDI